MFKLEYEDKFHIKDRGTVYTLTVDENLYEEYENLVGTDVKIDGKVCHIEAIEKFRPSIQSKWNEGKRGVGLLVRECIECGNNTFLYQTLDHFSFMPSKLECVCEKCRTLNGYWSYGYWYSVEKYERKWRKHD